MHLNVQHRAYTNPRVAADSNYLFVYVFIYMVLLAYIFIYDYDYCLPHICAASPELQRTSLTQSVAIVLTS